MVGSDSQTGARVPLVSDPASQALLDQLGFLKLDLLSEADLAELSDLHRRLHPQVGTGFDTDFIYLAPDHKREVDAGIRAVLEPLLPDVFIDARLFNVTFVVKWPGGGSELPVHQDWAYVDETSDRACTLWIPLEGVSVEAGNGPVGLLPRSHRIRAERRGANSVPWYMPYRGAIAEHLEYPEVAPGSALLFDNRLLHGSLPNRTDVPRRAVTVMVTRSDTRLRYHHFAGTRWEAYAIDEEFFVDHGPLDLRSNPPTELELLDVVEDEQLEPPLDELAALCGVELEQQAAPFEMAPMTGAPLGGSEPPTVSPWLTSLVEGSHRMMQRRSAMPMLEPAGSLTLHDPDLSVDEMLRHHRGEECSVPTFSGSWSARLLDSSFDVRRFLPADASPVLDSWLVEVGPHSEAMPKRSGTNDAAVTLVPFGFDQPPGTVVWQVGTRLVALAPFVTLTFDPTWEHRGWNVGSETVFLLWISHGHPLRPRWFDACRWALKMAAIPTPAPSPVAG